ncbi:hypothetical protein GCM10007036_43550 [Alsobacter metallidurans]|uniref:DUF2336 domain-containing protein n=1 Tax=Alsobacter metallidurans TaxID=340221 RepID=A0A917MJL6_9HYPH|nr:DUF2336 domain-containing protein [Alsobacter metallidurans]GGH31985.1 hypothetical protein GCM10007036_43550 [Alsobacter metallidurans]
MSDVAQRERVRAVARLADEWRLLGRHDPRRREVEAGLTRVLDDPSPSVRLALACELAADPTAPHHLVMALCYDKPAIAAEIAASTPVLIDSELVDLVALSPAAVQCAVALRPCPSAALSAAIAAVGEREACLTLLANRDAAMVKSVFATLLSRFGADRSMLDAIFVRPDAPVTVRHEIVERALAARRAPASGGRAREVEVERLRAEQDHATIALASECPARDAPDLVAHLISRGRLTTALLVRAAASGAFALIEHSLANLAAVSVDRVRAIMGEPGGPAFRALCARAGLPERALQALCVTAEVRREAGPDEAGAAITRALDRYETRAGDQLDDVLALMRRVSSEMSGRSAREPARRARPEPRVRSNYLGAQHGFRSRPPDGKVSA